MSQVLTNKTCKDTIPSFQKFLNVKVPQRRSVLEKTADELKSEGSDVFIPSNTLQEGSRVSTPNTPNRPIAPGSPALVRSCSSVEQRQPHPPQMDPSKVTRSISDPKSDVKLSRSMSGNLDVSSIPGTPNGRSQVGKVRLSSLSRSMTGPLTQPSTPMSRRGSEDKDSHFISLKNHKSASTLPQVKRSLPKRDFKPEIRGLDSFPDISPKAEPKKTVFQEGRRSMLSTNWTKLKHTVKSAAALNYIMKEKDEPPSPESPPIFNPPPDASALGRRGSYSNVLRAKIKMNMDSNTGTLKLERIIVKISDIISLKELFDEIDYNLSGTVSMDEVVHHRKNVKLLSKGRNRNGDDKIEALMTMMLSVDEEFTFEDLLLRVYPKMTTKDVKVCLSRLPQPPEEFQKRQFDREFWKEFEAADEYWQMFADVDGILQEESFKVLVKRMFGKEETRNYFAIADKETKKIHRKEFTLWWVNLYREERFEWEDIEEDAEAFWAKS